MKNIFKIGLFAITLLLTQCTFAQGTISTVAGNSLAPTYSGDGGQATSAGLNNPEFVIFDANNNMYISDANNNVIRKVTTAGIISTFAGINNSVANIFQAPVPNGGISGDGGAATNAKLHAPYGAAFDNAGNMYIADVANNRIRKIATTGIITVFAGGNGGFQTVYGYSGDGGKAINAQLFNPAGVCVDTATKIVYISDTRNNVIRKVATTGIITTFAGTGNPGYSGDGGAATAAQLNFPMGLTVGATGNHLYIADLMNNAIRRIILSTGVISTYAGTGTVGMTGDGGQATAATLDHPSGVSVYSGTVTASAGNIYIADEGSHKIRKVLTTGVISTYAGSGTGAQTNTGGYAGDGHQSDSSMVQLNLPTTIKFNQGHGYISDSKNNVIRKVN